MQNAHCASAAQLEFLQHNVMQEQLRLERPTVLKCPNRTIQSGSEGSESESIMRSGLDIESEAKFEMPQIGNPRDDDAQSPTFDCPVRCGPSTQADPGFVGSYRSSEYRRLLP